MSALTILKTEPTGKLYRIWQGCVVLSCSMQSRHSIARIGVDIDDTITTAPVLYAQMTVACRQAGAEVHVVTSRSELARAETMEELREYGVVYDFLHFIGEMSRAKSNCPHSELDWYQSYLWQKVAYAIDNGLTQFVDDDQRVLSLFEAYAPHVVAFSADACASYDEPYLSLAIHLACRVDVLNVAMLQRTLKLGYNRATRLVARIQELGVIAPSTSGEGWQAVVRYAARAWPNSRFTFLFLDFDGVLHPEYEGQFVPQEVVFCHLPRFEAVIADFPLVRIVISSTWRMQFDLDNLRGRFSREIASRIVGVTPQYQCVEDRVQRVRLSGLGERESEIIEWLGQHGQEHSPWIALDDAVWDFRRYRDHVVECRNYVGFDDAVAIRLRKALDSAAVGKCRIDESSIRGTMS